MKKVLTIIAMLVLSMALFSCEINMDDKANEVTPIEVSETAQKRGVSWKLNYLQVKNYCTYPAYNRSLYKHWIDANGDCENTRTEVLKRDSYYTLGGSCNSKTGGKWKCPFYCTYHYNKSQIDIDHFIPLKNAHKTGGCKWSSTTRKNFANDLGYYWSLRATSASANRSKGDRDPVNWLPKSSCMNKCYYSNVWIAVKYRWGLWVTSTEKAGLQNNCR